MKVRDATFNFDCNNQNSKADNVSNLLLSQNISVIDESNMPF